MDKKNITVLPRKKATPLQTLLVKDVDRKEFIKLVGLGLVAVVGIGPLFHFLTGNGRQARAFYQTSPLGDSSQGYGRSTYGQ